MPPPTRPTPHPTAQPGPGDITRQRLIEAATALFAERGFQGASVRDICGRAGTNVAAVNYHFGGKAELYRAVAQDLADSIGVDWPAPGVRLEDYPSWDAALSHVLRSLIKKTQCLANGNAAATALMRLRDWEVAQPTNLIDGIFQDRLAPLLDLVRQLVEAKVAAPVCDRTLSLAIIMIFSLITAHAQHKKLWDWLGHESDLASGALAEPLISMARQILTGGLAAVTDPVALAADLAPGAAPSAPNAPVSPTQS